MSQGKGDTYRPVDSEKFSANYERIFGKKYPVKKTDFKFDRATAITSVPESTSEHKM